jgi:putative ABC transport system permease protein
VILLFSGLFIVTVIVAGTYPSLLLSAYKPVAVLYGKFKQGGGISVRKFLTVLQFSIAVVFIICGIVMQRQMHFFHHTDTGIARDNVIMVPFSAEVSRHYTAFRDDISSLSGIQQFSIALHPLYKRNDMMGVTPPGSSQMILMPVLDVDQHFISMLGLKWKLPPADSLFYRKQNSIVLNETAVEKLNLGQNPLNLKVDQFEVAGVLKDFNWSSLQNKIDGLFLSVRSDEDSSSLWAKNGGCLFAKISAGTNVPTFVERLRDVHKKYDDENPFEYYFMDDAYNALYKAEDRLSRILIMFTSLAIVIACLGLFGLVTFMATQRTKEIGIRKTLGASVHSIVKLLSADLIKLVLIAILIASPVAWFFMSKWLQDFAYRINITWWMFMLAGLMAIIIAITTISFQAIKAAIANPVKSLRTE